MSRPRILVVDDEASNRGLVRKVLEPLGYAVEEAADGSEGIAAVARQAPDLILLDLEMPRTDGYAVLRSIKGDARTRLIPVVMITSHDQMLEKLRAVQIGVDEYLFKPFNVAELTARVKSLVSLKQFTDELEHASQVVESFAICVESRDRYTGNHCKRLGAYAQRVGRILGLTDEDLRTLHLGGVLHDIGKISISDLILNKPGKLTPEEYDLMKAHASVGADLLRPMRTLDRVYPLVRHHHERLDGSGYPDGIGGGEIPLLVRITSVVDVFDALHTRRSYKEALPVDKCLEILREESQRGWWDRNVVEALGLALRGAADEAAPGGSPA